jgi:hypothetical protein
MDTRIKNPYKMFEADVSHSLFLLTFLIPPPPFNQTFSAFDDNQIRIDCVFYLDVTEENAMRRSKKRMRHDDKPSAYNFRRHAHDSRREDIKSFFSHRSSTPMIVIDANGSIESVFKEIIRNLAILRSEWASPTEHAHTDAIANFTKQISSDGVMIDNKIKGDADRLSPPDSARIHQQLVRILRLQSYEFVGFHFSPLTPSNLVKISNHLIAPKLHGERRLLFLNSGSFYLFNTNMEAFIFPTYDSQYPHELNGSLFDGRIIRRSDASGSSTALVLSDSILFGGKDVRFESLPQRLAYLSNFLSRFPAAERSESPLSIRILKYSPLCQFGELLRLFEEQSGKTTSRSESSSESTDEKSFRGGESKRLDADFCIDFNDFEVTGVFFISLDAPYQHFSNPSSFTLSFQQRSVLDQVTQHLHCLSKDSIN